APAKLVTTKATTATKARSARTKKTPAVPVVATFPQGMLTYEIALEGPLGPGGIAHRRQQYTVTVINQRGGRVQDFLIGSACQSTTTRPVAGADPDDDPADTETIPTVVCRSVSAGWAQVHGVTRCIHEKCWPLQPCETEAGQR